MIGWQDERGETRRGTLFAAFAALADGQAWSFPALRPHQREPWHAFTVQVAALALIHAGTDTLPDGEAAWRDLLLGLTPDAPEAWEPVVDDWSRPALLQPPIVAPGDRAAYKNRLPTPDALDMLVTSRNHDVKAERMIAASDEDWLFALVTLQTYEGSMGAGNYGISRMNGGFASRMSLSLRPSHGGATAAFAWDVRRIVADARKRPDRRMGIPLLWTEPWDGTTSLNYTDLDELYVEICRRVRLMRSSAGDITACTTASQKSRVAYKLIGGNTLDPWAPLTIDKKVGSPTRGQSVSVTATSSGFTYDRMGRLLKTDTVTPAPLARASDDLVLEAPPLSINAAALVRGQGKTEGLHRRTIPQRPDPATGLPPPIERIGAVASIRATEAGDAGLRLRRALYSLVQGGPDKKDVRFDDEVSKKKTRRWIDRFDAVVDAEFFDAPFWAEVAGTTDNARLEWRQRLRTLASDTFELAAAAAPHTEVRRIRARVRARSFLDGQMYKWVEAAEYGE